MLGAALILAYALYTFGSEQPKLMVLTLPIVGFTILRYSYNIFHKKRYSESIEEIIFSDRQILIAGFVFLVVAGGILGFLR